MWGFQLWVNLPAQRKMIAPRYQDIAPEVIPELALERGRVRIIAGSLEGKTGPISSVDVEPLFLDVTLALTVPVPARHTSLVFVTDGAMRVGSSREEVKKGHLAVLSAGEVLRLDGEQGRALGEPVSRWGPFVMNTDDEIKQAIEDYRSGRLTL